MMQPASREERISRLDDFLESPYSRGLDEKKGPIQKGVAPENYSDRPPSSVLSTLDRYLGRDSPLSVENASVAWQSNEEVSIPHPASEATEQSSQSGHLAHHFIRKGFIPVGNGEIQRFYCKDDEVYFRTNPSVRDSTLIPGLRLRKYRDEDVWRTVDAYFETGATYRHLPRLGPDVKRPSPKTAQVWVNAAGSGSKSPLEVSRELQPEWGPFFAIDGTSMWVKGEAHCLLIAADCITQDTPHAVLLPDERDTRRIRFFLEGLRALGIDPKMWLIDDNPNLKKAVEKHQRFAKIQLDIFHKKRTINGLLRDKKINKQEEELKQMIFQFLVANSLEESETIFKSIMIDRQKWPSARSKKAIRSIESDHDLLLTHFHVDKALDLTGDRRSPRTTSEIEGVNSRIGSKRDKVRGFKSLESAKNFCNLLIMHYRAGPFESTKDKRGPLQRANRKIDDWIRFSQRRKSIGETKAPRA